MSSPADSYFATARAMLDRALRRALAVHARVVRVSKIVSIQTSRGRRRLRDQVQEAQLRDTKVHLQTARHAVAHERVHGEL